MRSEPEPDEKQETTIRLLSSRNPRQAQGSSLANKHHSVSFLRKPEIYYPNQRCNARDGEGKLSLRKRAIIKKEFIKGLRLNEK